MGSSPISGTRIEVELMKVLFFLCISNFKMGLEKGVKANVLWTFGSPRVESPISGTRIKVELLKVLFF